MARSWLIGLRNRSSLTQQQVADKADVKRAYYTQLETGDRNPSVPTAKRIATVLGFEWTLFFTEQCSDALQRGCIATGTEGR